MGEFGPTKVPKSSEPIRRKRKGSVEMEFCNDSIHFISSACSVKEYDLYVDGSMVHISRIMPGVMAGVVRKSQARSTVWLQVREGGRE